MHWRQSCYSHCRKMAWWKPHDIWQNQMQNPASAQEQSQTVAQDWGLTGHMQPCRIRAGPVWQIQASEDGSLQQRMPTTPWPVLIKRQSSRSRGVTISLQYLRDGTYNTMSSFNLSSTRHWHSGAGPVEGCRELQGSGAHGIGEA